MGKESLKKTIVFGSKSYGIETDPLKKQFLVDWRLTEVGQQNWEVCHRMLIHDLVDLHIPAVDDLLAYYHIQILPNGAHSAALPRLAYTKKPAPTEKSTPKRRSK